MQAEAATEIKPDAASPIQATPVQPAKPDPVEYTEDQLEASSDVVISMVDLAQQNIFRFFANRKKKSKLIEEHGSDALVKLREFEFPVMLNDTTRAYFSRLGAGRTDEMGKAMLAVVANPQDKAAVAVLDKDRMYHSMLRTTCVATQLDGGHANNALPQRAGALINCRIFPGVGYEEVRKTLEQVIADPRMTVVKVDDRGPIAVPPPLTPQILEPVEKLVAKYYPGVPLVPMMSTGGTDGIYFGAIGIPSYGPPGLYGDPDGNGAHGLNERAIVKAVYTGRDMLTELVKTYASPKGR
jgi:acetylornithine deacetylase/succinyl-diaminopimelate desuccinylase-like protein